MYSEILVVVVLFILDYFVSYLFFPSNHKQEVISQAMIYHVPHQLYLMYVNRKSIQFDKIISYIFVINNELYLEKLDWYDKFQHISART